MSYKIIVDSCGELTEEMKASGVFENVPLTIQVDDNYIVDDETLDQADLLKKIADSPNSPKTSCPSPERYMESYTGDADRVYVVTLSAELSGSYNSAVLGQNLYNEENEEKNIYVFNSRTASVGQTLIAQKIKECEDQGMEFEKVVQTVEDYIESQQTYFILECLDTLKKNGRLTGVKALVATALNIKPIMGSTPQGTICQLDKARGINKALAKMVDRIVNDLHGQEERKLGIAHCNCPERAEIIRKLLLEKSKFADVTIVNTRGISTVYSNEGGVIVVV